MTFEPAPRKNDSSSWMYLAVAAHRAVEALQVAVDDEGQVVQALLAPRRINPGFPLVRFAVAEEGPHVLVGGVLDAPSFR